MNDAEKAYQFFVIAVPENEEQAKAYFWARKALQPTLAPPNEAMTLDELREMEGQPVWVKCLKPNKYINPPVRWRILEKSIMGTFGVWDGESCLSERDYGTDWLAYRRPPEGES